MAADRQVLTITPSTARVITTDQRGGARVPREHPPGPGAIVSLHDVRQHRFGFSPIVVSPPGASLVFVTGQLANNQNESFEHQVDQGPASTIIPVPRLAEESALFEIDAIAMVHEPVSTE